MGVFLVTFQAVAALLGIGVVGFWIIGKRHLPASALGLLTSIAIDITLPCLVLGNIITGFSPQQFPGWWQMPLWWIGFTCVTLLLAYVTAFLVKLEYRGEFIISLLFQNAIFLPLIIIVGLFRNPNPFLVNVFLFVFLQPSLVFSTYSLFFGRKAGPQKLNWRRIVNPILIVTIIGLIIGLAGIQNYVPRFIVMILTLIGAMAVPLFMLILGGNVYNDFVYKSETKRKIYVNEVTKFTIVKNLLFPVVFWGLLIWLHPDYTTAFVIILQAAVPPITAIPILAERSGGIRAITNQFIVASFLFSIISIPLMIFVFSLFFPFPPLSLNP
jgi:malate permease and related proteins